MCHGSDKRSQSRPRQTAQQLMIDNKAGQRRAHPVVKRHKGTARSISQQKIVAEVSQNPHLRMQIAAVGGRGDEARATATA